MRKLAVCYPWSSPFMFTAFVESALNMEAPEGYEIRWFRGKGWCAARMHNHFFEQALEWGADLVCCVGSDQIHPPDLLQRLMDRHDEGCEVISALVPTREAVDGHPAFSRMAWILDGTHPVRIDPDASELQRINFIGSGVLMFPAELLEKVKRPWLSEKIVDSEAYQRDGTCDSTFVWRLQKEAHASVWVDTTLSVSHASVFEITSNFVEQINAASQS